VEEPVDSWQVEYDAIDADPAEARAVDVAVTSALLQASAETVEAYTVAAARGEEPAQWRRASLVSNQVLRLTAEELRALTEQVHDLLRPTATGSGTTPPRAPGSCTPPCASPLSRRARSPRRGTPGRARPATLSGMTHSESELDAFGEWERAAWETRAAPYARSLGDLTRGSVPALLDAARVAAGSRVLDVGTGPGFVALAAAARGAAVTAVDQSTAMVAIARDAGVDAVTGSATQLPVPHGGFDALVAGYLLNHLPRPEAAVAEFARVLVPGGRLAMTVWDSPDANPSLGLVGPVVTGLGIRGAVPPGPDSQRFADEGQVRTLLAAWQDVEVQHVRWSVEVEPGAWFDAVADSAPRTGAVLAEARPDQRAQARERYVEVARSSYGGAGGRVELPAGAVLLSATRP